MSACDHVELEGHQPKMTQAQPPAIERIPNEVFHEIFLLVAAATPGYDEHSFPVSSPHPLLPVVQVNRRFNTVASPLLVRNWRLRPEDESGVRFVLHLLKQPNLRSQIKSLAVDERAQPGYHDHAPRVPGDRWPLSFCSAAQLEQLAQSAEETYPALARWFCHGQEPSWAGQIRQMSPRAIAALALAWATGLEALHLLVDAWTPTEPGPWISRLVKMVVGVLTPLGDEDRGLPLSDVFAKLRCVSLGYCTYPSFLQRDPQKCMGIDSIEPGRELMYSDGPNGPMNGISAAPLFRLPSLRVFKALGIEFTGLTLDQADLSGSGTALQPSADLLFPNGTSGVEELHLYQSYVSDHGLSVLTRSCRRLRVLLLQYDWNDIIATGFELSSESIAAAIRLHSTSLEKIVIESSYDRGGFSRSYPGSLGDCLLCCNGLESLVIDLAMLCRRQYYNNSSTPTLSELLPPGLTHLGISIFPPLAGVQATQDNVVGLLRQCGPEGRFFKLKSIDLIGCSTEYMEDQEIIALAKKGGVELTQHELQRPSC